MGPRGRARGGRHLEGCEVLRVLRGCEAFKKFELDVADVIRYRVTALLFH